MVIWNVVEVAYDRRLLRRLTADQTLTRLAGLDNEVRCKELFWWYGLPLGILLLASRYGNTASTGTAAAVWIVGVTLVRRSEAARSFIKSWDQRRFDLIDPRKHSSGIDVL